MASLELITNLKLIDGVARTTPPNTTELPLGYMCFGVVAGKPSIWGNYNNSVVDLVKEGQIQVEIVQDTGQSATAVISQKGTTDAIAMISGLKVDKTTKIAGIDLQDDITVDELKEELGIDKVDNTSDVDKPVSTAVQSLIGSLSDVIDEHMQNFGNPHNVTKSQIGLGNVDNTSDIDKPVSAPQQQVFDTKVNIDDIVNSLDSSETSKPLSAAQGLALKNKIDGKEVGKVFSTIQAMVSYLNALDSPEDLQLALNLFVVDLEVPDFWVSSISTVKVPYTYTTDQALINVVRVTPVQIGYFKISLLETAKVDLSDYVQITRSIAGLTLHEDITKVALQQAIDFGTKVDKVEGKQLSTNDYTTDEKNKLAGIEPGAQVNVQSDWAETNTESDAFIKNKPTSMPADGGNADTVDGKHASDFATAEQGAKADTALQIVNITDISDSALDIIIGENKTGTDFYWELGTVTSTGVPDTSTQRIRTGYIRVKYGIIGLSDYTNYKIVVQRFSGTTPATFISTTGWITEDTVIYSDCYVRIIIAKKNDVVITTEEIETISAVCNIRISDESSSVGIRDTAMIIGMKPINFDFVNQKIVFPMGGIYNVVWSNNYYEVAAGTEIDITKPSGGYERAVVFFDTSNKTFTARYSNTLSSSPNTEVIVGAVWMAASGARQGYLFGDYTVNGKFLDGTTARRTNLGELAVVSTPVGYINFDFTNKKMTIPVASEGVNVIWRNKYHYITAGAEVDISIPSGYTRGLVYFNTNTKTFATYYSGNLSAVTEDEILVAVYWLSTRRAYMLCDSYSIDGVPVGSNNADILAPYFVDEVEDTVKKVRENTIKKSLVFTVITDSHDDSNTYFKDTSKHIKEVNKYINSDAIIHLGDLADGNDNDLDGCKDIIAEKYKLLRETNIPVFMVRGNHDDNSYGSNKELLLTRDMWYGLTQRQTDNLPNVYREGNNPYYYVDYSKAKVRCIFLDAIDYPTGQNGSAWWGYNQEQLIWLGEVALNTPDNYGVLVFSHMATRAELNYYEMSNITNSSIVESILQAYTTKGTYNYTAAGKTFDYSTKIDIEVIAYIHGHIHGDIVKKPTGLDYYYISIANSSPYQLASQYLPEGAVAPARTAKTVTQDCWDVMTLRPDERKIYMTRFGAGDDRVIEY